MRMLCVCVVLAFCLLFFYGWNCNVIGLDKIGLWKIKFERQMNTGHASMYQEASDRDWVEARLFFGIV